MASATVLPADFSFPMRADLCKALLNLSSIDKILATAQSQGLSFGLKPSPFVFQPDATEEQFSSQLSVSCFVVT